MAETDGDNALLARGGGGLPGPVLVNPLAAITTGNQAAQAEFTTRGMQAQQAWGQILQQATDESGNVDYPKAQLLAKQAGPIVQMKMMESLKDTSGLSTQQYDLHSKRLDSVMSGAGQLIADNPNGISADALRSYIQQQRALNNLSDQEAQAALGQISPDPRANSQFVLRGIGHGLQAKTALDAAKPAPTMQNVGPQIVPIQPSGQSSSAPTPSVSQGAGGVGVGMSPDATAEYQRWLKTARDYPHPDDPNVTKHGTNESYLVDTGVPPKFIYPGGAPATPGTQPGAASPLGTGRPPAPLLNPNKPQGGPAPTPAASPAGTGISGPTPAQKATANATAEVGKLSPPKFQAESDADTLAQNQQAILANMLVDTSQFTTGPLAGIISKVRNYAGNIGLNINTDAQSAKESFGKLAAGIAVSQAQAVGAGSDTRFNVVSAANPHDELSPAGVDLILRQLQGNADYIRARASLAAKHTDKANYPAFQESIKELDPRVFQLSRMTDDQRQTYWKNLKDTDQTQLAAAIRKAKEMDVKLGG